MIFQPEKQRKILEVLRGSKKFLLEVPFRGSFQVTQRYKLKLKLTFKLKFKLKLKLKFKLKLTGQKNRLQGT